MKKTTGQKRGFRAKVLVSLVFLAITTLGVFGYQKIMGSAFSWIDGHAEASATVTEVYSEVEEYRDRKSRKRTRTNHFVDYSFEVDGDFYESTAQISSSKSSRMEIGDSVAVWHDAENPGINALADAVDDGQATSIESAFLAVVPFTAGVSGFLYFLLGFIYVRESTNKLSEGFYTENSWLDVDDNKLVLLNDERVLVAEFSKNLSRQLQKAYQDGATHNELSALLKDKDTEQMNLADITSLNSRHDYDTILLEAGEKSVTLDFLNNGTKRHALEQIELLLPKKLNREITNRSRLRSAMPRLVTLGVLAGAGTVMNLAGVWAIIGFVALFMVIPKLIGRVISPTVVTAYKESEVAENAAPAPELRNAA